MAQIEEQIKEIEEEIRKTPYNKSTQHHIGKLKAKLAKLQDELDKRKAKRGEARGYAVKKSGHATVVLVGLPSVGKSTLLNILTDAESEVGTYFFTTLKVIPGVMDYKGAKIQVLDLPGLVEGASKGKGRGREVLSVARSADLILLMVDVFANDVQLLVNELKKGGIRLNQSPPNVTINRKDRGGVSISSTVKLTNLEYDTMAAIFREYGYINADIVVREDLTEDRLIDSMANNRIYTPALVVLNKIDLVSEAEFKNIKNTLGDLPILAISAKEKVGLNDLRDSIFEKLDFIRIYMRPQGKKADYSEPLVIKRDSSIGNVCDIIHRTFRKRFRYANIWGNSAKFPGQTVGMRHVLQDGDVLTIVVSK
ncbi:MAG: GTP-binding protein [Methanomassiliicoccales archaeon]|nr:MAG: GTP-binding protein [Methanomassiliicoccales archaeon]